VIVRETVLSFFNLCHLTLQSPDELASALQRTSRPVLSLGFVVFLSGLSTAVAGYYIRDYYDSGYVFFILGLTLVNTGIAVLWSLLLAGLIDALVQLQHPGRAGRVWQTVGILMMSTLPNVFAIAGAVPARLLARPEFLALPLQLALFGWSIYIALRGIVFQYEISLRSAVTIYLRALGLVLVFPFLFFLFIILDLAGKFS
jgi:hypothetical protein